MEPRSEIKSCALSLIASALIDVAASSSHSYNSQGSARSSRDWVQQPKRFTSADRDRAQSGSGNGYIYGQQPLVHTFETQASCMRRCTLSCLMQNVEDLMMPRWICPSQQSSELTSQTTSHESTNYLEAFDNQLVLLLVPLILILLIAIIIFWVRKTSNNDDEIV